MDLSHVAIATIGLLVGLFFAYLNLRAGKSLLGSFFKKYYRSITLASILFSLGWVTEFAEEFAWANGESAEAWHHFFLLIAGVIFVMSAVYFPKEAEKLMKPEEKTQQ